MTLRDAADYLNRVAAELGAEYPATNQGWGVALQPLAEDMVGDAARVLWVLFAAVGLVLVVSCANVALLSLMRGLDRQSETGMRLALGASTGRLLRQCLLESALVAALGGVAGTALAFASLRVLPLLAPALPRQQHVAIDGGAILFIVAMTGLATFVSGLPPAWRRSRAVTGALRGMLYGVAPADPVTALAAVGVLAIVGVVATLIRG